MRRSKRLFPAQLMALTIRFSLGRKIPRKRSSRIYSEAALPTNLITEFVHRVDQHAQVIGIYRWMNAVPKIKYVADIVAQLPPVIESLSGIDLHKLIKKVPGMADRTTTPKDAGGDDKKKA